MKSDAQIQHEVYEHLKWDPRVNETDIGVAVNDGVVTLSGSVPMYAEKIAAEEAAKRTPGVKAVAEEIADQADRPPQEGRHGDCRGGRERLGLARVGAGRREGHRAERLGDVDRPSDMELPADFSVRRRAISGRRQGRHERHHGEAQRESR